MMQRVAVPLGLVLVLLVGAWLLWTRSPAELPRVETPPAPQIPTRTPTVAAPQAAAPEGEFRLAGTAVGQPGAWAAIESPDGSSNLYRLGDVVADLGEIVAIQSDHVVVRSDQGETRLRLKPAATATPDRRRLTNAERARSSTPRALDDTPRE